MHVSNLLIFRGTIANDASYEWMKVWLGQIGDLWTVLRPSSLRSSWGKLSDDCKACTFIHYHPLRIELPIDTVSINSHHRLSFTIVDVI